MKDLREEATATAIHTLGYEKTDVDKFVQRLLDANIEVLVDVRDRPISRKKGFSKTALSEAVSNAGMEYHHVRALGDPKPGRDAARAGQMNLFRKIFSTHMKTTEAQEALAQLAKDSEGKSICLLCFERDHETCHRSIVAAQLSQMTGADVTHLKVNI